MKIFKGQKTKVKSKMEERGHLFWNQRNILRKASLKMWRFGRFCNFGFDPKQRHRTELKGLDPRYCYEVKFHVAKDNSLDFRNFVPLELFYITCKSLSLPPNQYHLKERISQYIGYWMWFSYLFRCILMYFSLPAIITYIYVTTNTHFFLLIDHTGDVTIQTQMLLSM